MRDLGLLISVSLPTLQVKMIFEKKFTCERQLKALNISKKTKHVNVIVVSRAVILSSII